jgi:hypothetical protein
MRICASAHLRVCAYMSLRDCARGSRRVFARWLVCACARMRVYANECDRGCVYLRIYAATYVLFCLRDLQQRCRCMVACTIDVARHAHAARSACVYASVSFNVFTRLSTCCSGYATYNSVAVAWLRVL